MLIRKYITSHLVHGVISDGDDFGNENGILMANLNDEDSRYNIVQRRKECVFSKTQVFETDHE